MMFLDTGFRRNDVAGEFATFYENINVGGWLRVSDGGESEN
jgi:hypothetical protein